MLYLEVPGSLFIINKDEEMVHVNPVDGDCVSLRGLWTDEANLEAEDIMNRKMTALDITGTNSKIVEKEVYNSYYSLTKIAKDGKVVNPTDHQDYLATSPDGFTRSKIAKMFADTVNMSENKNTNKKKARYNTWDKFTIPANYFYDKHGEIETTIGRFMFNKYVLEGSGVIAATKIVLDVLGKKGLSTLDDRIADLYMNDVITRPQFNAYVDRRDNLGYWLNGMLVHTISPKMAKPLKEIEVRKKELYKKHAEAIANNDINVMHQIEVELVDYAKEILKDDPGMELYDSGDLNFGANYKNNAILKGPVFNKLTNEFDFVGSSFMNGIEIKDLATHANGILAGQFPASIATQEAGYMGKKILALLQMAIIDEPGTDCGAKSLIPITITERNKRDLKYSYIVVGGQLQLLTDENINSYIGQIVMMRSPMSCTSKKICSICAGQLFYKLDIRQAGLFATQLSHSLLNLGLKTKHISLVELYSINPDTCIENI